MPYQSQCLFACLVCQKIEIPAAGAELNLPESSVLKKINGRNAPQLYTITATWLKERLHRLHPHRQYLLYEFRSPA
jgi:hypothetical protein